MKQLELKQIVEEAIYIDGEHHKQYFLIQIAKVLGIELEEGIAP
ncbi:hypothetical protein [Thermoflavimicrobium daqui]|nr:hypothetical protein [Thermoflavimicrobium daqui]